MLTLTSMNQCIFSQDRSYRYVLRCICTDSATENTAESRSAGCNPEKAQYCNPSILQHPTRQDSRTACPTKPKLYSADRSSRPRKLGTLHNQDAGEVGTTRTRTKSVSTAKRIAWIGLNPSTADEITLDQTLAAVCRYSRKWGFTEVVMLNLFAFRATDPRDLKLATDPIGPDNDKHLLAGICAVDRVIACWGDHGRFLGRDRQVSELLGVSFECLLRNRTGTPHHPLYLRSRIKPKRFRVDQIRN
jgi:hypothetical protein